MSRNTKIFAGIVTGALVLAGIFGVIGYRQVFAQTPTPSAGSGSTAARPFKGGPDGGMRGGYTDAQLAAALNITTDQLTAARKTAAAEALKQAVAKGLITQAQADQITASGRGFGGRFLGPDSGIDYEALLAQALNISADQLKAAEVKAVNAAADAAVAAGTMTQAQADLVKARAALSIDSKFQSAMQTAYADALKQAVADGVITQAQADALLAQQQGWGGGFGRGFDGFGGRGGHGHGGFGPDFDNDAPPTPGSTSPTPGSSS